MFKFGFSSDETTENPLKTDGKSDLEAAAAEEVILFKSPISNRSDGIGSANMMVCGNIEIGYVNITPDKLKDCLLIKEVEQKHSDLIPGKYEGGLKVWECTQDILQYVDEHELAEGLQGKRVLDLGCGCGLLGILALECGAIVDFQDYNKEVIELFTIPNVLLNAEEEEKNLSTGDCKFYCGDWDRYSELIGEGRKYDLILTSETIYNPENYDKLARFFVKHLSKDGYVLLGAKGYYFGVGGSVTEFKRILGERYPTMDCETVWKNEVGVKREVLKIKLKE